MLNWYKIPGQDTVCSGTFAFNSQKGKIHGKMGGCGKTCRF